MNGLTHEQTTVVLDFLEAWGIVPFFHDVDGRRWDATAEAAAAVVRAMGFDPASPPPEDETQIRVLRPGDPLPADGPVDVTLEDGTLLKAVTALPPDTPFGYHEIRPHAGQPPLTIIYSPGTCWLEPTLRTWGWAVQLYALRSAQSWGHGDLADLRRLARWTAELGGGALLVNPLGAVAPTLPQTASPYSPISRQFRNPLYLCIDEVPARGSWATNWACPIWPLRPRA